jgi:predicted methyltransferase
MAAKEQPGPRTTTLPHGRPGRTAASITFSSRNHKRYALELHRQVWTVLRSGGSYLVCDHFYGAGGMSNDQLYMTVNEQSAAIIAAGFASVRQIALKGGMVLHHAI